MLSDIEIAENCALRDIADVAAELGWYRSTVSDHEKYIFQRVEEVAKQLYTNKGAGD